METIRMFWHPIKKGLKLSPLEWKCMESVIEHGHELHVYTYVEMELPDGSVREDANEIIPFKNFFIYQKWAAAFADLFRYSVLYKEGGWWLDTDVLVCKDDLPQCDYYWAEVPGEINNAVLKFPKGDPLLRRILNRARRELRRPLKKWSQIGPILLTDMLADRTPSDHSGFTEDCYAVDHSEEKHFWKPEYKRVVDYRTKDSTFIHFWHHNLGNKVYKKPPKGSFLRALYKS